MRLTWNTGYHDYTDTENWLPRYEELVRFADTLDPREAAGLPEDRFLDSMEQLEELMRYYCSQGDANSLEPVMRKFNAMLPICEERGIWGVEPLYLEMVFLRMNGVLYRAHGQNRQSADSYDRCVRIADLCARTLKESQNLTREQRVYVGWNCIECRKEAAEVHDLLMETGASLALLLGTVPLLQWLDDDLLDFAGIAEKVADMYAMIGGTCYSNGDHANGDTCHRHAVALMKELGEHNDNDIDRARAIWLLSIHGTMDFMTTGNTQLMVRCEKEAEEFLEDHPWTEPRNRAIVESSAAMVSYQRSLVLQQSEKLAEAISMAEQCVETLGRSLDVLLKDLAQHTGYAAVVLKPIVSRVSNVRLACLDSLGVMYYYNDAPAQAEKTFREILEKLSGNNGYEMAGSAAVLIQAEALQYLAMLAGAQDNGYQLDFYATQAADMACEMGRESNMANAWRLTINNCCLVAEYALSSKNKPKAATYAQMGLDACDALKRLDPGAGELTLRKLLTKFLKKASRRFF